MILLFIIALLLSGDSLEAARSVDGTFRLRALKPQLDQQLRARYVGDGEFRQQIKASARQQQMIPGQTETGFQVYNFAAGNYEYRPGQLVAQGKFCNIFVEKGKEGVFGTRALEIYAQIVKNFDEKVYPSVSRWFGKPEFPNGFNLSDEKIYIFLVDVYDRFADGYVAGYFDHRDIEGLFGNQKPVFFMDINPGDPGDPDDKSNNFYRTLAHEFQHMVNFSIQHAAGNFEQERWLDEGFSMFSEYVFSGETGKDNTRIPPSPHFERFLENPAVNLVSNSKESWFREDFLFRQYGASFMFMAYLVEKFGGSSPTMQQQFTRELVRTGIKGTAGLDQVLSGAGTSFVEVFVNFALALVVDDAQSGNGLWGFTDKIRSFGTAAQALPLKMTRYFAASGDSSFIGSDNRIQNNCINTEEINGKGNIVLNMTCEKGMTPFVAEITDADSGSIRPIRLDADGKAQIAINFNNLRRFFVLPMALNKNNIESQQFNYSFKSSSHNFIMYPVPNPAFPEQFMIFLKSFSGPLDLIPQLQISFGNLLDCPRFEPVDASHTLFVAHYRLPGDGYGQAVCSLGDDSCSFSFSAVRLRSNLVQAVQLGETKLLVVPEGSESNAMIAEPDSGAQTIPTGALAGPYDVSLTQVATARLILPQMHGKTPQTGLCRTDAEGHILSWHDLSLVAGITEAGILTSGRYYLITDRQSPKITSLQIEADGLRSPVLKVAAEDKVSGADAASLKVFVDDILMQMHVPLELPVKISLESLREGRHDIRVELADRAGNRTSASIVAQIALPVGLIQAVAYPNPCRNRVKISMNFSGNPVFAEAQVKIYDTAGHLVADLAFSPAGAATLVADWNLQTQDGKRVSNGLYFYRANAFADNTRFKATGKIAVLR